MKFKKVQNQSTSEIYQNPKPKSKTKSKSKTKKN